MRREATEFYVVVILVIRRRRRDCEATAPALPTAAARASLYLAGVQMVRLGKYLHRKQHAPMHLNDRYRWMEITSTWSWCGWLVLVLLFLLFIVR
jgi:hypothetical protein